jgi:hypothetical protein
MEVEVEVGGLAVDVEGELVDWGGTPYAGIVSCVEVVEYPQRVLMMELSWVTHCAPEMADCDCDVGYSSFLMSDW